MRKWILCCALVVAAPCVTSGVGLAGDGAISEFRLGVLAHDPGIFSHPKENGIDLNGEIFFRDLGWFGGGWEARPSIGGSVNLDGGASQAYAGVTFGGPVAGPIFVELGVGAAVHNGELETTDPDRKELGCRVLFHLAGSVGIMLSDTMSLSAYLDHMSNGNLCDNNEGLETAGARAGFRF